MRNKIVLLLISLLGIINLSAKSDNITEERSVGSFRGVDVCCGIQLYIQKGQSSTVTLEGEADVLKRVVVEVKKGDLRISYKGNNKKSNDRVKVYISADKLDKIKASSAAFVRGENTIKTENMDIHVSSAAEVNLNLEADKVGCYASSAAKITLKGKADEMDLNASSAASMNMKDLKSKSAQVKASSAANIEVGNVESLKASASSGANVKYRGHISDKNVSASSGGNVSRVD